MKILMLLGLMFVWSMQPLIMIISLVILTLVYSFYIYFMMGSFWFSYMLLLVMLSGILVIFTYMMSLIPDESFEMMKLINFILLLYLFMMYKYKIDEFYEEDKSILVLDMWSSMLSLYNMYLIVFLFMMMLMVVWLSMLSYGALRNI